MRAGRAARIDGNHPVIVEALRKAGAFVQSLATIGDGCPDIVVGFDGLWFLLEIKVHGCSLTDDEKIWHRMAARIGNCPVYVVETVQQALDTVGARATVAQKVR